MTASDELDSVRYIVDDVAAAIRFYTTHLGFTLHTNPAPAFADVTRRPLRLRWLRGETRLRRPLTGPGV